VTAPAVIGSLVRDVVGGGAPRPGGAVFHAARALARGGAAARLVTRCAAGDRESLLGPLERLGLPVAWRAARTTGAFSFRYEEHHRVMSIDALADPWTPADIGGWAGEALGEAAWVQVGALVRSDFPPETIEALAASGRRLLLDAQGLARRSALGPIALDAEVPDEVLAVTTVLKLNEEEAEALAGGTDERALATLGVPEVILTLGPAGALIVAGGRTERIAPRPLAVADPTGAGDAFSIGYLLGRSRGLDPFDSAREAAGLAERLLAG
jgi:sugar/nucleoside kinase (ribokinase family)